MNRHVTRKWHFSLFELIPAAIVAGVLLGLNVVPTCLERNTDISGWRRPEPPRLRDMKTLREPGGVVYMGIQEVRFNGWPLPFLWRDVTGTTFAFPLLLCDVIVFAVATSVTVGTVRILRRELCGRSSVKAESK